MKAEAADYRVLALLFQVALDCFVSEKKMTEHCLFALRLLPFQILNRFVQKAYLAPTQFQSGIEVRQN